MSHATLVPNLRAAFRTRLLTLSERAHAPGVSVSLASGVLTRVSGSWITAGFCAGQEITVTGFGSYGALVGQVDAVTATALKTDISGSGSDSDATYSVLLPANRAGEGQTLRPIGDAPYVAEAVQVSYSRRRSIANGAMNSATIEHKLIAAATYFYPHNRGTLAIEQMAGATIAHFSSVSSLSYGGDRATIENVSRSGLYRDGERIACAVMIDLLAFTQD